MKVSFSTVVAWDDPKSTPLTAADLATATYTLFLDTVNPPVKTYPVPAANIAAATPNVDGSKTVTVDAVKDLGLTLVPNGTYYVAAQDSVDGILSLETAIITYKNLIQPKSPGNFTVA